MLELKHVSKSFGKFKALDNLSMTIPQGSVYGLVGPNGAGKTTAIRHITGVYRPDAGEITMEGLPIYENPQVKQAIGYIPDEIFYFASSSLEDMAKFYRGLYPRFDMALFQRLSEVFQLPMGSPIRRFSKGMQKQAAFQLTLSIRPDVLVLDEPVDGLDPVMRRQVMSLILAEVAERNTTVLISSHNLRELEDVCDHVGIMNHGRMLVERSLSALQDNIVKIQLAFADGGKLPEGLEILHRSSTGRLQQLILRGSAEELTAKLSAAGPLFLDVVPLNLEEIFIYELGGADHEVKDIIV